METIELKNAIRMLINGSLNDPKGVTIEDVPDILNEMVENYKEAIKDEQDKITLENNE